MSTPIKSESNFQFQMSNNNASKNYDIHERIFAFVVSVIQFLNKLSKSQTNLIFINQATRSVTSMGANDQEADGALTRNDFIHCFTIVRKEAKETVFWMRIIEKTNTQSNSESGFLIKEGNEIVAIVSTIIKNASESNKARK